MLVDKKGPFVQYEDQWSSRHILLVPSTIRDAEATETEINEIRSRILAGEDFSDIAKEVSISSNASSGGLMPWRRAVEMPELFSNAVNKKEIGFVSELLESGAGNIVLLWAVKKVPFFQMKIKG